MVKERRKEKYQKKDGDGETSAFLLYKCHLDLFGQN